MPEDESKSVFTFYAFIQSNFQMTFYGYVHSLGIESDASVVSAVLYWLSHKKASVWCKTLKRRAAVALAWQRCVDVFSYFSYSARRQLRSTLTYIKSISAQHD